MLHGQPAAQAIWLPRTARPEEEGGRLSALRGQDGLVSRGTVSRMYKSYLIANIHKRGGERGEGLLINPSPWPSEPPSDAGIWSRARGAQGGPNGYAYPVGWVGTPSCAKRGWPPYTWHGGARWVVQPYACLGAAERGSSSAHRGVGRESYPWYWKSLRGSPAPIVVRGMDQLPTHMWSYVVRLEKERA